MTIAIIDTSVFCNMLQVPGRNQNYNTLKQEFDQKIAAGTSLLLPIATIFETGNHIAHITSKDGSARRSTANRFVTAVTQALKGKAPYTPIRSDFFDDIPTWLSSFPDNAMRKISFGDTTIISEFNKQCTLNPRRRVYIWAYDGHLSSYDRPTH